MAVTVNPVSLSATNDPPPPYPSRERRARTARSGRRRPHPQQPSTDSDHERDTSSSQLFLTSDDGDTTVNANATETTPLLTPPSTTRRLPGRPRAESHASTVFSSTSAAPSLSQTVLSFFHADSDLDYESEGEYEEQPLLSVESPAGPNRRHCHPERRRPGFFSKRGLRLYFRPLGQRAYYGPLFHLVVPNFPYALAAWVYLFVFTLSGTALLMALPLGAVLCFLDLLGARTFARGELALQTRFHGPLAYPPPYPPRPIFARLRSPGATPSEAEAGGQTPVYETSFYKNTYAMFTDATSYQALFYFLVIKPSITLALTAVLLAVVPVAFVLVLPAPAVLRAVRRIGIWQAGVAVEGLYFAVS